MKLELIVKAYKALGEAKVTKLEESEVVKIVKMRKAMRPHAEDYEAFLKDAQEKFKDADFEKLQEQVQKWKDLSDEEKVTTNKALMDYQQKIDKTVKDELAKEIEIILEKLNDASLPKMLQENGWETKKLDELEAVI